MTTEVRAARVGIVGCGDVTDLYLPECAPFASIRTARPHRADGELGLHVLDVLLAIETAASSGDVQTLLSRVDRPEPLPG